MLKSAMDIFVDDFDEYPDEELERVRRCLNVAPHYFSELRGHLGLQRLYVPGVEALKKDLKDRRQTDA